VLDSFLLVYLKLITVLFKIIFSYPRRYEAVQHETKTIIFPIRNYFFMKKAVR